MSKKKQRAIKKQMLKDVRVDVFLKNYKLKDLQRECIMRGMDFEEMVKSSVMGLQSWLIDNFEKAKDKSLLTDFDVWMDRILYGGGNGDLVHPSLNLGHFQDEETGIIREKKIKGFRKSINKKERTADGIFKGTKKAYTYELCKQGKTKDETIELVMEKFPDAKDKSIGIWYNRAKKLK